MLQQKLAAVYDCGAFEYSHVASGVNSVSSSGAQFTDEHSKSSDSVSPRPPVGWPVKLDDGMMQTTPRQFWPCVVWQLCLTGSASRRSQAVLHTANSWLHGNGAHKVSTGNSILE